VPELALDDVQRHSFTRSAALLRASSTARAWRRWCGANRRRTPGLSSEATKLAPYRGRHGSRPRVSVERGRSRASMDLSDCIRILAYNIG
jgi:hypothetical protein